MNIKIAILALFAFSSTLFGQESNKVETTDSNVTEVAIEAGMAAEDTAENKFEKIGSKDDATLLNRVDAFPTGWLFGAGMVYSPTNYVDQYDDSSLIPIPVVMYFGEKVFLLGTEATYTISRGEKFTFVANAKYRFSALEPNANSVLSTLESRNGEIEAGIGVNILTKFGYIKTKVSADISGQSGGYLTDIAWTNISYKKGLLLIPSLGVTWYNSKISNYYYGGVSQVETNIYVPNAYDTGSVYSLNSSLIAGYRLAQNWMVIGGFSYSLFSDGVSNSPVMKNDYQANVFASLGYMWD